MSKDGSRRGTQWQPRQLDNKLSLWFMGKEDKEQYRLAPVFVEGVPHTPCEGQIGFRRAKRTQVSGFRDPLYLQIPRKKYEHLFAAPLYTIEVKDPNPSDFYYVSVVFLANLGTGLKADLNPKQAPPLGEPEWLLKENQYTIDWAPLWNDDLDFSGLFYKGLMVPLRDGQGEYCESAIGANYPDCPEVWRALVGSIFGVENTGGGKPIRNSKIQLYYPLLIQPRGKYNGLFNQYLPDITGPAETRAFEKLIEKVNKELKDNIASKKPRLELYDTFFSEPGNPSKNNFMLIDKDPFDWYQTYIHMTDWQTYMSSLRTRNISTVRRFPMINEGMIDTFDSILSKIGGRDQRHQWLLFHTPEILANNRVPLEDVGELTPEARASLTHDEGSTANMQKTATHIKMLNGIFNINDYIEKDGPKKTLCVELDAGKIEDAIDKRGKEPKQLEVMGGASATDIAGALGWEKNALKSGQSSAEWLHLSAFSWGGFAKPGDPNGYMTSQNPENLVFGSSETNSLMTRYEHAWQALFVFEQSLEDAIRSTQPNGIRVTGSLKITSNDLSEDVMHDCLGTAGAFDESPLKIRLDNLVEIPPESLFTLLDWSEDPPRPGKVSRVRKTDERGIAHPTAAEVEDAKAKLEAMLALDEARSTGFVRLNNDPKPYTTYQQMVAIATQYMFIAYSIDYSMQLDFKSRLLGKKAKLSVRFLPFRRPLFHRAQARLDELLFDAFAERVWEHYTGDKYVKPRPGKKKSTKRKGGTSAMEMEGEASEDEAGDEDDQSGDDGDDGDHVQGEGDQDTKQLVDLGLGDNPLLFPTQKDGQTLEEDVTMGLDNARELREPDEYAEQRDVSMRNAQDYVGRQDLDEYTDMGHVDRNDEQNTINQEDSVDDKNGPPKSAVAGSKSKDKRDEYLQDIRKKKNSSIVDQKRLKLVSSSQRASEENATKDAAGHESEQG